MKFSTLDDSYWAFKCAEPALVHKAFLDRHRQAAEYEILGLKIHCPPDIYHPSEFSSTRFALKGLFCDLARWGNRVLEVGTGCGAIGLCLAQTGRDVTMLDINPVAVQCAKDNAVRNNIQVAIHQSDLFSAVAGQQYDFIFFNIPLMDKVIEEPLDIIACDYNGELFTRFMREAKYHLAPGGYVCVSVGNIGNRNAILEGLSSYNDCIIYAEFYANMNEWRWVLATQPN